IYLDIDALSCFEEHEYGGDTVEGVVRTLHLDRLTIRPIVGQLHRFFSLALIPFDIRRFNYEHYPTSFRLLRLYCVDFSRLGQRRFLSIFLLLFLVSLSFFLLSIAFFLLLSFL
ncbi:hypothetical protein PMAYCL1PPCAC_23627, partial [Pristionchus mayeri]